MRENRRMIIVGGEAVIDLVPAPTGEDPRAWRAFPGGSAVNTAVAAARLGHPAGLLARLSTDVFGQDLRAHLAASGVLLDRVVDATEPSTLAVVATDAHGAATYSFYTEGTSDFGWLPHERPQLPADCDAVHVTSFATLLEPSAAVYADAVASAGAETVRSYDPNVRPKIGVARDDYRDGVETWVATSDLVRTSDEDLRWLYPGDDPLDAATRWAGVGPALVVVTQGGQGVTAVSDGERLQLAAEPVDVVDTVGAGDSFSAGLLVALAERDLLTRTRLAALDPADLRACLAFAVRVAAITCGRPGADPPWRAEIEAVLEEFRG